MNRFLVFLIWLLVIAGAAVAFDQVMMRMTFRTPVLVETQTFYRDFRSRLVALARARHPAAPTTIEGVIEQHGTATAPDNRPAPETKPQAAAPSAKTATAPPPVKPPQSAKPAAPAAKGTEGYVYVDSQGELHMAARLEEIPKKYRAGAQPLKK